MSVSIGDETWKAEFYPIPAHKVPKESAVAHSLRKWRGLTPENLAKHGLTERPITVFGSTCALCQLHHRDGDCKDCPLVKVLGKRCDASDDSPYKRYLGTGDPAPMIQALEAAEGL